MSVAGQRDKAGFAGDAPRWAIIGYGWVASDYMTPALEEAGHRLAAIVDPNADRRREAEAKGIAAHESVEALIATGGFDLAYVATPNHLHRAPVAELTAAGLPVLCEKPLASHLADAEALAAAVQASGHLYGTAFDQRHHPAHEAMRTVIGEGRIGRPVAIRIVYACWVDPLWSPSRDTNRPADNWRSDPDRAGGGAVIDLAPHGLDLSQYLVGEPLQRLSIALQRRVHDYAVDDGGMLSGVTGGGILFSAHVAYNCAEVLPRRRIEILGEEGLLIGTDTMGQTAGGSVHLRSVISAAEETIAFDTSLSPFRRQAEAFAAAAAGAAHDFSIGRDIALARLFHSAYEEARQWL